MYCIVFYCDNSDTTGNTRTILSVCCFPHSAVYWHGGVIAEGHLTKMTFESTGHYFLTNKSIESSFRCLFYFFTAQS